MRPIQSKMARGALGWGVRDVPGVSHDTVVRFERGEELKASTVEKLAAAYDAAGILFIEENGEGPGIRLKKQRKRPVPKA